MVMVLLLIICDGRAQTIPFPDPPPIVPRWSNVARFSGQFPDTNWTFYGTQYPAFWYPTSTTGYTNWPGVADAGSCMNFVPYATAGWAGASTLVTNTFDDSGNPLANMMAVYVFGGSNWNVVVSTTNDLALYEAEIGSAQMLTTGLGGGMYIYQGTNWSRLSISIPAMTNPVVKITIRIPWKGHFWSGAYPPGYIAVNGGIVGGVTWDAIFPPAPPGPLTPPAPGMLAISRWTNGTSVVYWSTTNSSAILKQAGDPAGPYSSFGYTTTTNMFGTNVIGTLVDSTNIAGFYRLETD